MDRRQRGGPGVWSTGEVRERVGSDGADRWDVRPLQRPQEWEGAGGFGDLGLTTRVLTLEISLHLLLRDLGGVGVRWGGCRVEGEMASEVEAMSR